MATATRPLRCSGALFCYDLQAGNGVCPLPIMFGSSRQREAPRRKPLPPLRIWAPNGDEAPPCMRWRGLAYAAPPWPADCSAAACYVALTSQHWHSDCSDALCYVATPVSESRYPRRSPGPSIVPVVSLGADPVFGGERFLLPIGCGAQGLSERSSRFFSHPQDICCLSRVHGSFPPRRPQFVHRSWG